MRDVEATVLEGHGVRLEPLGQQHAAGLAEAVRDGELWCDPLTSVPSPDGAADYIAASAGRVAFAVVDATAGRVVGSTSYYDIDVALGRLACSVSRAIAHGIGFARRVVGAAGAAGQNEHNACGGEGHYKQGKGGANMFPHGKTFQRGAKKHFERAPCSASGEPFRNAIGPS